MAEKTNVSDTVQLAAFNNGRGMELITCLKASDGCFSRCSFTWRSKKVLEILWYVDRPSMYNLVNKASLVHCLVCRSICSCIPDSHPHRITSTKCSINTVVSPDGGHIVARNM